LGLEDGKEAAWDGEYMDNLLHERLILLTAAVTPAPTFNGTLSDPTKRLQQYHRALRFWCEVANRTSGRVLVVETSGADPMCLREPLSGSERRNIAVLSHKAFGRCDR
jgi:hypothetical protein